MPIAHNLGFPPLGPNRELKRATEGYWSGKVSRANLLSTGATLRVAATLAALGVPPKNTVDLLEGVISAGRSPSELLDLPSEVQAGVAQGATPAQAAQGLGRGAAHAPPGQPGRPPGWAPPGQQKPPNPHKP